MMFELTKKEALERYIELEQKGFVNISKNEKDLDFRNEMLKANEKIKQINETENLSSYQQDLLFGLELFKSLDNIYGVSEREASQDAKWRHLSLNVIPDLVHNRWGFNESRFYQHSSRMYLKSMWWYIYLSWQGSEKKTFDTLKKHTTDEVSQIVDRAGSKGYRVDLYRELMKYYGDIEIKGNYKKNELFRKVMKLNTARVKIIEPALYQGGTKQYVKELFDYFD